MHESLSPGTAGSSQQDVAGPANQVVVSCNWGNSHPRSIDRTYDDIASEYEAKKGYDLASGTSPSLGFRAATGHLGVIAGRSRAAAEN